MIALIRSCSCIVRNESFVFKPLRAYRYSVMNSLVPAEIEAYAQAHSMPESDLCRPLREETQRRIALPQMIVGPGGIS